MQYESFRALRRSDLDPDPIRQFALWFDDARQAAIELAEGAILATAAPDATPSARTVLLKSFDQSGFVFFTNYASRKGEDLERNPKATLLFWWRELGRQVRIEGTVGKVTAEESDAYFATRPRGSQIAAWASEQSRPIEGRAVLERSAREIEERYAGLAIPRPPAWGGYTIAPDAIELWQGQPDRLHDRFLYTRSGSGWKLARLAP